jgi:hypothetical protein
MLVVYPIAFSVQQRLHARKDVRVRLRVLGSIALWCALLGSPVAATIVAGAILPGSR